MMNRNLLINSAIVTLVFWAVVGVMLYRRHQRERAQEITMRELMELDYTPPPCILQMDKTKPNYNDCGAMIEPVSPMGDWDGVPTTETGKWIMQNGRPKAAKPKKEPR